MTTPGCVKARFHSSDPSPANAKLEEKLKPHIENQSLDPKPQVQLTKWGKVTCKRPDNKDDEPMILELVIARYFDEKTKTFETGKSGAEIDLPPPGVTPQDLILEKQNQHVLTVTDGKFTYTVVIAKKKP